MKKYFNPEYNMVAVMSKDIVTCSHRSHEEIKDPATGEVIATVDTYRDTENNTFSGVISTTIGALGM